MVDKKEIRDKIKAFRKTLTKEDIVGYSNSLWKTLYNLEEFKKSKIVMSYMSFNNEIDTTDLNRIILESGRTLLLPRVEKDGSLSAVEYTGKFLVSKFGIEEPVGAPYEGEIDLVIVPGLGFDHLGNRVGYGKGYYDRFFTKHTKCIKIAPAFESQLFETIKSESNDIQIDGLLIKNNYMITKKY